MGEEEDPLATMDREPERPRPPTMVLWAARTSPYNSPYAAYPFFHLPFCHYVGEGDYAALLAEGRPPPSLGEVLGGYAWEPVAALPPPPAAVVRKCTTPPLTEEQARLLSHAATQRWFYEFNLGDLPVWGMVGEPLPPGALTKKGNQLWLTGRGEEGGSQPHIYTRTHLVVNLDEARNPNRVDLESPLSGLVAVEAGKEYEFQMEITYTSGALPDGAGKYDRYTDHEFFNAPVRKFSQVNSLFVLSMLLLMVGAAARRIWRYNDATGGGDAGRSAEEGAGVSLLPPAAEAASELDPRHVFAPPPRAWLLAAFLGNGRHLLAWALATTLWLNGTNSFEYGPGGRATRMVYVYAGTSGVAGHAAARYVTQQRPGAGDGAAVRTGVATALLVPVCVAAVGAILAAIAAPTGVIGVVSVPGVLRLLSLWLLVVVPSHVAGALVGRWHRAQCGDRASTFLTISIPPCERDKRRRLTVALHKFTAARPRCVLAFCILSVGLTAFGTLSVESHFIMTGLWNHTTYLVSWTSLTALILLLAVICALSAVLVLFSFAAYPPSPATPGAWQWHAFAGAASTGGYAFLYSVAFFVKKTHLEGSFGVVHYFGTMSLISAGIALACGAAGHWAACRYVTLLYSHSKVA